jgi:hypothetical protein
LNELRYLSLSEKRISQEVVVESKDFFENLSIRDSQQVPMLLEQHLIPLLQRINKLFDITTNSTPGQVNLAPVLNELNSLVAYCHERANDQDNRRFREIFVELEERLKKIAGEGNKLNSAPRQSPESQRAYTLLNSNIGELTYQLAGFTYSLLHMLEERSEMMSFNRYIISTLQKLHLNNLIDLETPYFSLPPQFAEAKERELLAYLRIHYRDPAAVLALVNLYIEMRNIADAELLFSSLLGSRGLPYELEKTKDYTEALLRTYREETNEATLTRATIHLQDDLHAEIQEVYALSSRDSFKKGVNIIILLPYLPNEVFIRKITDERGEPIPYYRLRPSWKNSSVLALAGVRAVSLVNLEYAASRFIGYVPEFGKFNFKYGGVVSSGRFVCQLFVPPSFKVTQLSSAPERTQVADDVRELQWADPNLQFRFSALRLVGQKTGIAGELVHIGMLQQRQNFSVTIIVIFLAITTSLRKTRVPLILYDSVYILAGATACILLIYDLDFVERLQHVYRSVNPLVVSIATATCWVAYVYLADRLHEGTTPTRVARAAFEMALNALLIKRYIELIDLQNQWAALVYVGVGIWVFLSSWVNFSVQLQMSKKATLSLALMVSLVLFVISKQLELFSLPREIINGIGYGLGLLVLLIIGMLYLAYRRVLKNRKIESNIDYAVDLLAVALKESASSGVKVTLVFLVMSTVFFSSALSALGLILVGALLDPFIERSINRFMPHGRDVSGT